MTTPELELVSVWRPFISATFSKHSMCYRIVQGPRASGVFNPSLLNVLTEILFARPAKVQGNGKLAIGMLACDSEFIVCDRVS